LWCSAAPAPAQQAVRLHDRIAAIAGGNTSEERKNAITAYLDASGIDYTKDEFTLPGLSGTNIVANVPGKNAGKVLLLGAHYDRVPQGKGAVDNAGSCAVLLELLSEFKSKPLENYSVRAIFFDLEERGLVGSQAYFAKARESGLPALALNLDIFAYGDTFFATASAEDGPLAGALQQAAQQSSMPLRLIARNQYPASDHRIMMLAGIETVGLALIDGAEIDALLQPKGAPPRILTIIHSDGDTMDKVRTEDMEKALPVLEKTIRLVDAR
jgi:Zn-dependent M28 family amino/carboxypeptidase